ncbi:MAG: zinc ribbon domain-containing protein [Oscillospiraceae bacterium]
MVCPRCKEVLPDDAEKCEVCGKKLKKTSVSFFKKKQADPARQDAPATKLLKSKKLKIALLVVLLAAVAVIVIILIVSAVSGKGLKTAKELSKYIGKDYDTSIDKTDLNPSAKSNFDVVNHTMVFNSIVESEDGIKVDGVNVPEWAVTIHVNDKKEIADVTYTDFTVLKDNVKGEKLKSEIDTIGIDVGDPYEEVSDSIGLDPYRIVYTDEEQTYSYRYYYKNSAGDEIGVELALVFDDNDEFVKANPPTYLYPDF